MSDNTPFAADPTQIIATDDVSGIKHQRVKIEVGADGSASDVLPPASALDTGTGVITVTPTIWDASTSYYRLANIQSTGDGDAGTRTIRVQNGRFNGSNYDREYGNLGGTALASAARTTTTSSADLTNWNHTGVHVILVVTAGTTLSLTTTINGKDPVSGNYYAINANPTAVTTSGTYVYSIFPGVGAASGGVTQRTSGTIPRTFNVTVTVGNANSATYSVGYNLMI